jgi:hypothetical protein
MRTRGIVMTTWIVAALCVSIAASQGSAPSQKKDAPGPAGKWTTSIETPHGAMMLGFELKVDQTKVTGTLSSEQLGKLPVTGEFTGGRLAFKATSEQAGDLEFTGRMKDQDTLVGNFATHIGDLPCTATRVKEK